MHGKLVALQVALADLPKAKFPVLIECLHPQTRAIVHRIEVKVPRPGTRTPVYIPPLARRLGHPVMVRVTFGDGEIIEAPPPPQTA